MKPEHLLVEVEGAPIFPPAEEAALKDKINFLPATRAAHDSAK